MPRKPKLSDQEISDILERAKTESLVDIWQSMETGMTYSGFHSLLSRRGFKSDRFELTDEEVKTILERSQNETLVGIWRSLNLKISFNSFRKYMIKKGYKRLKKWYEINGLEKYIRDHIENARSYKDLAKETSEIFNIPINSEAFKSYCINNGITMGNRNTGRFGEGRKQEVRIGIGEEASRGYDEEGFKRVYVRIHNDGKRIYPGDRGKAFSHDFIPKQVYLWELNHPKVKEDEIVVFIDGDKNNFNLDNLMCIKKKSSLAAANSHMVIDKQSKLNELAYKFWEFNYKIKE